MLQEDRLPAPRWAENDEGLPRFHDEVEVSEHVVRAEELVEPLDLDADPGHRARRRDLAEVRIVGNSQKA